MAIFNYDAVKGLLRCPKSRADLVQNGERLVSCDAEDRLSYPIVDGIPVLLSDEATRLSQDEWSAIMAGNGRDPTTGGLPAADSTGK